jgi:PAS domain-containing protein
MVLRSQAGTGGYLLPPDYSQPLNAGLLGWVWQHGEDASVPDLANNPTFHRIPINRPRRAAVRSELCMRVSAEGTIYALLNLEDWRANAFSTEEREQLRRLLDELGEIIQQRRKDSLVNAAFNATPTAVLLIDEKGIIRDGNPAGAALLQLEGQQLIGQPIAKYVQNEQTTKAIANGGTPGSEVEFVGAKDRRVKGVLAVLPLEGTLKLRMLAFRDTSAQRRAQQLDALMGIYADLARQVKPGLSIIGSCRELRQRVPLAPSERLKALLGKPTLLDDVPELVSNIIRNLRRLEGEFEKIILLGSSDKLPGPEPITLFLPTYLNDVLDEIPLMKPEDIKTEIAEGYVRADPGQLALVIQTILSYLLRFRRRNESVLLSVVVCSGETTFSLRGNSHPSSTSYTGPEDLDRARAVLDFELGKAYLERIIANHQGCFLATLNDDGRLMIRFTLPTFQEPAV